MKLKVKINDEVHEVDEKDVSVEAAESGDDVQLLTQDRIDGIVEHRLKRERKGHEREKEDLVSDDDFFERAARYRGIELDESGSVKSKIDPEKQREIEEAVRKKELRPTEEERDQFKGKYQKANKAILHRDLLAAAPDAGVREDRLATTFSPIPEFIRTVADEYFQYDEDEDAHYFVDSNGNPVMTEAGKYASPGQVFDVLRKQDKKFQYFERDRPKGTGSGSPGNGSGGAGSVVTREQMQQGDFDPEAVASGTAEVID